jgi:2-succinyl-5-enolpyruvyl-6-hydroxy-3-cyclohexene-1-carboxylate synthase
VTGAAGATDPTRRFALTLVDELARCGLRDAVLAPGSRSAPLALALAEDPRVRVHVHLDERAAGFFALGAAKQAGRPVAVLCTSGTAAANLHPAAVEARHAGAPLLLLTADRPPELRHTGANQTIDQLKLYGDAVRWFCEVGVPAAAGGAAAGRYWRAVAARGWAEALGPPAGPVQLNLPLDEPLVPPELGGTPAPGRAGGAPWTAPPAVVMRPPTPGEVAALAAAVRRAPRGLLVAGWGAGVTAHAADAFAAASGWPVLADPLSGLRRGPFAVGGYDLLLRAERFAAAHRPQLVVRAGAGPTSKVLAGWLDDRIPQVLLDPDGAWPDPQRAAAQRLTADPSALLAAVAAALDGDPPGAGGAWRAAWARADACAASAIARLLDGWDEPFEGRVARDLVACLPDGATLVVGSSMPVRDLDAYAPPRERLGFVGNRGASGIDGFVATALGVAALAPGPVAALCGDLSFLHDASSVLGAARRRPGVAFVVVDNDGGGIFSFLPQARLPAALFEPLFGTPHGLDLTAVATAAGLPCRRVERAGELPGALAAALAGDGSSVLVVPSERARNLARHREVTAAVVAAVHGSQPESPAREGLSG